MNRTSLYDIHVAAGATIVPFAGWDMPVSYAGTVAEVEAVRQRVGLFDVSHMGEFTVTGADLLAFLQSVTANDVSRLKAGRAQYSLLLNEAGGVIDDIIVYRQGPEAYLLVVNAGCLDNDWSWLTEQAEAYHHLSLLDISAETALIAVQGPDAVALVSKLIGDDTLAALSRFHFTTRYLGDIPLILSRTGYTGEDGFEIALPWEAAPSVWTKLTESGATPAGLGARDVLRLEAAYPLYGHELDTQHKPSESGVAWAVKPKKGAFIGSANLESSTGQKLVGIKMNERAIPRDGYPVLSPSGDTPIGQITSGTYSPTVKAGIAMARVESGYTAPGTAVMVDIRGRKQPATVVDLPFYRNGV